MGLYAYIGIVDTMLKLAIAFLLGWIAYDQFGSLWWIDVGGYYCYYISLCDGVSSLI